MQRNIMVVISNGHHKSPFNEAVLSLSPADLKDGEQE